MSKQRQTIADRTKGIEQKLERVVVSLFDLGAEIARQGNWHLLPAVMAASGHVQAARQALDPRRGASSESTTPPAHPPPGGLIA